VAMDDSPAQLALTHYSQSLWNSLAPHLPLNVEFEKRGTLWVAADEEEMQEVERKHMTYREAGIPSEILDSAALASSEPNLRRPLAGGLLVPSDGVLYPPSAAYFFLTEAQKSGAKVELGQTVLEASQGIVRLESGEQVHTTRIIQATGADSPAVLPGLPVKKRKGHLVITDRYPGFVNHQLVELGYLKSAHSVSSDSVAFNVQPRRTGQLLIGSSRQYGAEDSSIDQKILTAMIKRTLEYLPAAGELSSIRVWTGFRAATPDKLPLIGPYPHDTSLFLATGHEGLGITTSLATAQLLADHFSGRIPKIPFEPYLPKRFSPKEVHV
jgi:D-hydroxyproline dehydrogenase subunit beta